MKFIFTKKPIIKLKFKKVKYDILDIGDVIKFSFFGRKFIVDSINYPPRNRYEDIDLTITSSNGEKTYKVLKHTKYGNNDFHTLWVGRQRWPLDETKYKDTKEGKLYLIRYNEVEKKDQVI